MERWIGGECIAGDALTPESHVARMDVGCMARRAAVAGACVTTITGVV